MSGIDKIDYTGLTRRIDLRLREKYPLLKTRIIRVATHEFVIYVENHIGDFNELAKDFDQHIKYMGVSIKVVENIPDKYLNEIQPIADNEIPSDFEGMPFNLYGIVSLIQSKHPSVEVSDISDDLNKHRLKIILRGAVDAFSKSQVLETVLKLKLPLEIEIQDLGVSAAKPKGPDNPTLYIASSKEMTKLGLPFLRRDEKIWFENIGEIYKGAFTKENLYFYDPEAKCCFVDLSVFKNINLRNHLLLYDTIFCSLPLLENFSDFFEDQKISRKEFLYLVEKNRIKVIITQPEYRYDFTLLKEVYDTNPNCIVSRRAIAALCAIDIVDMNKDYLFTVEDMAVLVTPISKVISELTGIDPNAFVNSIMWPKFALRASFDWLNVGGTKRISNFGVNRIILDSLPLEKRNKYEFEFVVNAEAIHIAHALDATYFPFLEDKGGYSDKPYAVMMGNALNLYRCLNKHRIHEYIQIDKMKDSGVNTLDPISVLEANNYLPISEFEAEVGNKIVRTGFKSIFDELARLDDSARKQRIDEYNKAVDVYCRNNRARKTAFDLGMDTIGVWVPFLGTARNLASFLYSKVKHSSSLMEKLGNKIEEVASHNITGDSRISLLTKINRVARLKRDYKAR